MPQNTGGLQGISQTKRKRKKKEKRRRLEQTRRPSATIYINKRGVPVTRKHVAKQRWAVS